MAEAIFCYDQCLRLNSSSRNAAQNRLLALNYCNDDNERVFLAHQEWGKLFQRLYEQDRKYEFVYFFQGNSKTTNSKYF